MVEVMRRIGTRENLANVKARVERYGPPREEELFRRRTVECEWTAMTSCLVDEPRQRYCERDAYECGAGCERCTVSTPPCLKQECKARCPSEGERPCASQRRKPEQQTRRCSRPDARARVCDRADDKVDGGGGQG